MRVLQATDTYPPPLVGGQPLHVQMLARELADRGHEVEVAALAGPGGPRTELDGVVPVHRVAGWSRVLRRFYEDPERPFHPTVPDPGVARSLFRLVQRRQPDVVHAHSWIVHSLLAFLPTRRTRLVATMHEYGAVCARLTYMHHDAVCTGPRFGKCIACASGQYGVVRGPALAAGLAAARPLRRRVDRYLAVSTPVAEAGALLTRGSDAPIVIVPPFLADDSFEVADHGRPEFVPPTGDYLMFAGALGPHKGIDVLLDAYAELRTNVPLVVVGLRRHDSPSCFPPGVIVVEDVPHDDVMRAFRHCAIALVPSRWPDPCPLVALEAMAAGAPVIASATGGLVEQVADGVTGRLVPPGDVAALRAAIADLLADPDVRRRMGAAGRRRALAYSAGTVVPRIEAVYREVTAERSSPVAVARARSWLA